MFFTQTYNENVLLFDLWKRRKEVRKKQDLKCLPNYIVNIQLETTEILKFQEI